MDKINSFRGDYYFLSNFYPAKVTYEGVTYESNEAAFQAQKTLDMAERRRFAGMGPSEAKKAGRRIKLRRDWEQVKEGIMRRIVHAKFTQNKDLREKLLATGSAALEEGNNWGDRTWGTVDGVGRNLLGKILMDVRDALAGKAGPVEDEKDTLVVLERSNGWYGGYLSTGAGYVQVFNTAPDQLFDSIYGYTDKVRRVRFIPKSGEAEFMEGRLTLEQAVEQL